MPFLHNAKVFTLGSCSLLYHLVRHPVLCARHVFRMPMTLRGLVATEQWPAPDGAHARPIDPEATKEAARATNPLEAFFQARKEGKGIWKWLHYFDIYHHHLSRFVGREVHVLEIGVHSGGSLEMWRSYFGPKCHIYGVDREPACKVYEGERTTIFVGDQEDHAFWRRLKEQVPVVDIVIDDGGHMPEQQVATLQELLPHIAPGGVYICEDVHGARNRFAAYVHALVDQLNAYRQESEGEYASAPTRFQQAVRAVHFYTYVTVIERNAGPVGRLVCEKHGTEWQPF